MGRCAVSASPAQIANDMSMHAAFWAKRDRRIERACRDAARVIRSYLDGQAVDGRTFRGVWGRLLDLERPSTRVHGYPDFTRARLCLDDLKAGRA